MLVVSYKSMTLRGTGTSRFKTEALMQVWDEYEVSGLTGRPHADCIHHIEGRSGKYNNSIVNAVPLLNQEENIAQHGLLSKHETKVKLFKYVLKRLAQRGYEFTDEDRAFVDSSAACREALLELSK